LATFPACDVSIIQPVCNLRLTTQGMSEALVLLRPGYFPHHSQASLNYGLRWEIYSPQSVTGKGAGGWVDLNIGFGQCRWVMATQPARKCEEQLTKLGAAPGRRLSSYAQKTVVRLGYGRSFDIGVFGSVFGTRFTQNLPVLVQQQLNPPAFHRSRVQPFASATATFPTVPSSGQFSLSRPR